MEKFYITPAQMTFKSQSEAKAISVRVVPPPWGYLDTSHRDETRPEGRTIRGDNDIKRDPVLRSAWGMR